MPLNFFRTALCPEKVLTAFRLHDALSYLQRHDRLKVSVATLSYFNDLGIPKDANDFVDATALMVWKNRPSGEVGAEVHISISRGPRTGKNWYESHVERGVDAEYFIVGRFHSLTGPEIVDFVRDVADRL